MMKLHRIALSLLAVAASATAFAEDAEKHRPSQGDVPPPYLGRQLGGPEIRLDAEPGKAYVVSFWASWCGPCMKELPILANIQQLGGDNVKVIAVNIEERDVYRRLQGPLKETGLTPAFDPDHKAQDAYGVKGIPHMVIVGRNGRITSVRIGYSDSSLKELAAQLNEALAVPLEKPEQTAGAKGG
jgi:thiol-disulfide isomerase/thioredoxin